MSTVYVMNLRKALRQLLEAAEANGMNVESKAYRDATHALAEIDQELFDQTTTERLALREFAEQEYGGDDDISFDDGVFISKVDHGIWVSAWAWVYNASCECGEFLDSPFATGPCKNCKKKGKANGQDNKAK